MDSTPAILYYRVPSFNWKKANKKVVLQNPGQFLQNHKNAIRHATVVSATGTYAVLCVELGDDPHNGTLDREFIMEFDTRELALTWLAAHGVAEYVVDYAL